MSEEGESLTPAFLGWFLGCTAVYSALFGTGYFLYGRMLPGLVCLLLFGAAASGLLRVLPRLDDWFPTGPAFLTGIRQDYHRSA